MTIKSFSPIPEDDDELHLPELVYWASLGDIEQVEQALQEGLMSTLPMKKAIVPYMRQLKMIIWK